MGCRGDAAEGALRPLLPDVLGPPRSHQTQGDEEQGRQHQISEVEPLIDFGIEHGDRSEFGDIDQRPPEKVPVFLDLADVFVLASIYDAFPSAIVEAFAAKKPVVATRVGGVPEIVEDGVNGYLVPRMDPRALAEKIDVLLEDEEKRRAFGEEGRRRVAERFTLDRMIEGAEAVFHRVCRQTWAESRAKSAAC